LARKEASEMLAVEVNNVTKRYDHRAVVKEISFSVNHGEIFGLIGPNGAGKTTTIRMMMDIIKPDSGDIRIFGETLGESTKNRVGYLPEERGLYKKLRVIDSIIYLASLKGISRESARDRAGELLKQVDMLAHQEKKIEALSRGMGQIIQFIVTILHDPELIILDEPFAGLDPVNTELLKEMILDLRSRDKAVILSTHQMNQVEELCDRVLMINKGEQVLYGDIAEIKSKYSGNSIRLNFEGRLPDIPGVVEIRNHRNYVELVLNAETTPEQILKQVAAAGITVKRFEIMTPSLNEIFIKIAGREE